jgi:hypothetical protein
MPDLFDASQIPDDAEYWNALARRIGAAAREPRSGMEWLARGGASWIAAASMAAVAASLTFLFVLATRESEPLPQTPSAWALALGSRDRVATSFRDPAVPPRLTQLVLDAMNDPRRTDEGRRP